MQARPPQRRAARPRMPAGRGPGWRPFCAFPAGRARFGADRV